MIPFRKMLKYVCIECRYIYSPYLGDIEQDVEPGASFDSVAEDWRCPACFAEKERFIELVEQVNEVTDPGDLLPQEEAHVPFYRREDEKLIVRIGSEDEPFVQDDVHFVEYVSIVDLSGEILDSVDFPDVSEPIIFPLPDEDFRVLMSCSQHGIWKGLPAEEHETDNR